jgi:hypothetical protein
MIAYSESKFRKFIKPGLVVGVVFGGLLGLF